MRNRKTPHLQWFPPEVGRPRSYFEQLVTGTLDSSIRIILMMFSTRPTSSHSVQDSCQIETYSHIPSYNICAGDRPLGLQLAALLSRIT
jgi:hypothetical protein